MIATDLSRRRLVLRWTGLAVFVIVLGIVFVNLGQWQLRRLDERRANNERLVAADQAPLASFESLFAGPVGQAQAWHRVAVTGTFDARSQLVVRHRSNSGKTGFEVITPLRTDSGAVVLVDRGFLEVPRGKPMPRSAPPPPTGRVRLVGQVRENESGTPESLTPADGSVRSISAAAIGPTLPYPIVDGFLNLLTIDPPQSGGFRTVPPPELSDGPHFWYAVQWFMFTVIGILGIVVFIRADLRERRAAQLASPNKPGTPEEPNPPEEVGSPEELDSPGEPGAPEELDSPGELGAPEGLGAPKEPSSPAKPRPPNKTVNH